MRSDGRRGPEVGKVAVVPEDEFGEDDVLDDGVDGEVGGVFGLAHVVVVDEDRVGGDLKVERALVLSLRIIT